MKKLLVVVCLSVLLLPAVAEAQLQLGLGARYMGVGFDLIAIEGEMFPLTSISANNKIEMNSRLGVKMSPLAIYLGLHQVQGGTSMNYIDESPFADDTMDYEISFLSFKPELTIRYYIGEGMCQVLTCFPP